MANNTDTQMDERALAWMPWLSWLKEHPESIAPEVNDPKSRPPSKEDSKCEDSDDDTAEWVHVEPYDAESGTLPRECMNPAFLAWVNSEGRHLMEDDPKAIKGVTRVLRGQDKNRAAIVRELIKERWKKAAAVYEEQTKNKTKKARKEPLRYVTQDKWTSENLIFPKLSF
ncbi:hypothetical protein N0V84_005349 [Fusarium piperis]|uniref:Uncharacterized protein n=1 Tax=Fusarium piperis TaxID=1435070 RepID=A0A9W8WDV5_9HYPO|nr:hypothetical protein N0V84_005349 [Fusarium piperis]